MRGRGQGQFVRGQGFREDRDAAHGEYMKGHREGCENNASLHFVFHGVYGACRTSYLNIVSGIVAVLNCQRRSNGVERV